MMDEPSAGRGSGSTELQALQALQALPASPGFVASDCVTCPIISLPWASVSTPEKGAGWTQRP